jgi:hypothetical protein
MCLAHAQLATPFDPATVHSFNQERTRPDKTCSRLSSFPDVIRAIGHLDANALSEQKSEKHETAPGGHMKRLVQQ